MSDDLGRTPTRRSLREQRRVSESADGGHDRGQVLGEDAAAQPEPRSSGDTNELDRVTKANRSRRAADVPFDMVPEREEQSEPGERSSLQRARDREALKARREAAAQPPAAPASSQPSGDEPAPLTRRQLRLQALAAARAAAATEEPAAEVTPSAEPPSQTVQDPVETQDSLSVEAALEARRQTVFEQPVKAGAEAEEEHDDLEILAKQRELAARAAIISRRVAERERLKRAHSTRNQDEQAGDPFTGAMDRLRREKAERDLANTGINAPETSGFHLQIPATGKGPAVEAPTPGAVSENVGAKPEERELSAPFSDEPGRDAARQPVSARSAQGLDPLDYQTGGARRANIWAWTVLGVLLVGAAALTTGIILITTHG
ncbi:MULTISPECIES: hypothetical protein [Micrococcaceae]|uniref:hypothetical protein n=1 Tax=Micrococcaceae TaxID=1268 RepID=UPI000BB72420|nr:hypothetical protein [Glutamicibacter sp. BW78]PCC25383.1 hypothetical protein CIK75_06730 [Glutamicibacter sp. BW78]